MKWTFLRRYLSTERHILAEMNRNCTQRVTQPVQKGVGIFGFLLLLTSCTTQQSVLYVPSKEVDSQSMELGDVQTWPERMVTMTGRMEPCPETIEDVSHALDDFENALTATTTLLERGNVKEAILEEWQEQMSGLYDESTTVQWGNLVGAEGVATLDITCRSGIQVHAVTVSDVETGQRVFKEQYVGGNVASAMNLFAMELTARDQIVGHPLEGVPEEVLRDSSFSFFDVDELGAVTWRTELEAVMQRALGRYRPSNRMNLNAPLEVDLDLDPFRGATVEFHTSGLRSEMVERYLRDATSGLVLPSVPSYAGVRFHATAEVTFPFRFYYDPQFHVRVRMEGAEGPQEVRDALRGAPPGNYEFQYRFWQLGVKQSNETRLISAQPRSAGAAVALSALAPGMGMEYVTYGKEKGVNWFLAVALPAAAGLVLDGLADRAYSDYQDALTPDAAESTYAKANRLHKAAFVTLGVTGVLWSWNLVETRRAADRHRQAIRQFAIHQFIEQ